MSRDNSQATHAKNPHDLNLLLQRFLQLVQQRHGQDEDREIGQGVETGDDGGPEIRVDAVVLDADFPRRVDGHALED